MFLHKAVVCVALSTLVSPGAMQMTSFTNQAIKASNIKQASLFKSKTNAVTNQFIVHLAQSYHWQFSVQLSNSTYNGFPGFMDQIQIPAPVYNIHMRQFFFQWLDDNDFSCQYHWPDLNWSTGTKYGNWHYPFVFGTRLETHMGHFGPWSFGFSETADDATKSITDSFLTAAENAYKSAVNPAGILFNFNWTFHYTHAGFAVQFPDLGHSYQIL